MQVKKQQYTKVCKVNFPCASGYVAHRWNGDVNQRVGVDLMELECVRCGLKYKTLYAARLNHLSEKYRANKK